MTLKVVAYYTNEYYYRQSLHLSHSLNRFGVTYEISKVQGPKTWNEAVSYKPRFILDSLVATSCDAVIYTDCDSKLQRSIPSEELTGDVGYVPFKRNPHETEEALTGTLYFKNTAGVKAFILDWIDATPKYSQLDTPEQMSLREVLERTSLNVQRLSHEWCWIFDDFKELFPNAKPPIFEHFQASRTYKDLEKKGQTQVSDLPGEVQDLQGEGVSSGYVCDPSEWKRSKGASK